jgi:hypothetical protein
MNFNNEKIGKTLKNKGYAFFEDGEFNVNIIGVRNSATGKRVTNAFRIWQSKLKLYWLFHTHLALSKICAQTCFGLIMAM